MAISPWLIAGPGAVGRLYALALREAGEDVKLLYRKNSSKKPPSAFEFFETSKKQKKTLSSLEWTNKIPENARAVLLCVRTDNLEDFLAERRDEILANPKVPIVFFQPGFHDREKIEKALKGISLAQGNPGLLAYFEGEVLRYWIPTGVATVVSPVSGETAALLQELTQKLTRGGVRAKVVRDVAGAFQAPFALGMPLIAAWQEKDFDEKRLAKDGELLRLAAAAGKEGLAVGRAISNPPAWTAALSLVPSFVLARGVGFLLSITGKNEMISMWKTHASKIREQTREMIGDLIRDGRAKGLPVGSLEKLQMRVWG
ncbi:MAG: 2-dehydropantoate 2-reductase N-terminal domain-containing protein [Bdellovibrionota bacterium]